MHYPILCIPRLPTNIERDYIIETIQKMNIGIIETLHEIPLQNNPQFKRIIIRVKWDTSSPESKRIYDLLEENKSIKIVHCMPWYWICVKYAKQGARETSSGLDSSLAKLINNYTSENTA